MKNSIQKGKKVVKAFVHRHEYVEAILFMGWGMLSIIRAYRIFRNIPQKRALGEKPFTVIIPSIRTFPIPGLVYFDAVFAHAFRLCGARVKILFHDNILPSTDSATIFRSERPQNFVARVLGSLLKKSLNLPIQSYRDFITSKEIRDIKIIISKLKPKQLESYHFLAIPVGLHAKAATVRYFLTGQLTIKNPAHVKVLREKLFTAMITAKVASEVVKKEDPQLLFFVHGVYSAWGPWYDYFQLKGIDSIIYGAMTLRFGTFIFNRNNKINTIVSKRAWSVFQKKPLSTHQEQQVYAYFRNRAQGSTGDQRMYQEHFARERKKRDILKELSPPYYERRYIMYTNLIWDIATEGRVSNIFEDAFQWIDEHITFFKKRPSYQLIIKPHPAELVWEKTAQGVYDYVSQKHSPLPPNITILKPDTPFNAYDLLTPQAIGLLLNGTLGFELAAQGIPVLVAAQKVHYYEAGIVPKVRTEQEYYTLLEDAKKLRALAEANKPLAMKYAYFYLFRSIIRIPFYRNDVWSTIDWQVLKNTQNLFGPQSSITKIVKKAMNAQDIVKPL